MKKLSINVSNEEYRNCISGKVNGKDLADCDYEDIYDFSKSMLEAVAEGILENPSIEVGDAVIKTGAVFGEIYGIVTHKQNGICTVMFGDGHTALVLEDGLRPTGSKYKFGKMLNEPITGYKKAIKNVAVKINGEIKCPSVPVIVTLEIPRGAIVFSINGSKCRTNKARILDIGYLVETDEYLRNLIPKTEKEYTMISEIKEQPAHSMYDHNFYYIKGDEIKINNFDMAYNLECSRGIHFFLTKKEAIDFTF